MADKYNIDLDDSFISKIFEITDAIAPPSSDITLVNLKKQLYEVGLLVKHLKDENEELKTKLNKRRKHSAGEDSDSYSEEESSIHSHHFSSQKKTQVDLSEFAGNVSNVQKASEMAQLGISMNYGQSTLQFIDPSDVHRKKKQFYDENGQPVNGKILIVDDLGIITYQLSVILKRAGYLPVSSKEIYDAIEKYKRSTFDYVIMDLFIPTEREGFILLEELKKIDAVRNEESVIAIMSASTRKDYKQMCQKKGAAFYVEKQDDWQKELFGLLLQYN